MLSERFLTNLVKGMTNRHLDLQPTDEHFFPDPKPDTKYMLYLHVPFCQVLCPYCSFNRYVFHEDIARTYFKNLRREMMMLKERGWDFETLYFGGGTPTILLDELCETIDLARDLFHVKEVNSETNPNHLIPEYLDKLKGRIQRLSVGVQSFDDEVLRILGRAHDAEAARAAVRAAQERFDNVSVDLMCGIPGQSAQSFAESVREAVALGVAHVSVYPLTIEPHTPFDRAVMRGEMDEPDEDVEAAAMEEARRILEGAGFHRYEVASYARPGFESRHNTAYWTGKPYLGLGRSAVTMTQNAERRMRVQDGQVVEDLDARQMAAEDLMLGMRMARGVSDEQVTRAAAVIDDAASTAASSGSMTPGSETGSVLAAFDELASLGLAKHADGRWRPTDAGWLCGNELYGRLLDLAP